MIIYNDTRGNEIMFAEEFVTPEVENMILLTAAPEEHENLRRAFELLHDQEEALLATASPEQRAITGGDYCRRVVDMPGADRPLAIYGQVTTDEEIRSKESQAGASQWKIDQVMRIFEDGRKQGWVHGTWYSAAAPDGDAGSQHVGTLEVITREEYERARAAQWA